MKNVLDNGMTLADVAASMLRVYARVVDPAMELEELMSLVLDGDLGNGWVAAAAEVAGLYAGSGEQAVSMPATDLADRVVQAFAAGSDTDVPALAALPPPQAIAWEAVARHAAAVVSCDEDDAGSILETEAVWRPWAEQTAAKRGVQL